jgi:hypothetical protein
MAATEMASLVVLVVARQHLRSACSVAWWLFLRRQWHFVRLEMLVATILVETMVLRAAAVVVVLRLPEAKGCQTPAQQEEQVGRQLLPVLLSLMAVAVAVERTHPTQTTTVQAVRVAAVRAV